MKFTIEVEKEVGERFEKIRKAREDEEGNAPSKEDFGQYIFEVGVGRTEALDKYKPGKAKRVYAPLNEKLAKEREAIKAHAVKLGLMKKPEPKAPKAPKVV